MALGVAEVAGWLEVADWLLAASDPLGGGVLGLADAAPCEGWLAWAASPLAAPVVPAAPGLAAPLLVVQLVAMCCTELTVRVLLAAVPLCEPELGAAEPEVPVDDELPVVPVICTS